MVCDHYVTDIACTLTVVIVLFAGKDEPLSDYTETERKQFFRQKLLPIVQQMSPQYGIKVYRAYTHIYTLKRTLKNAFISDDFCLP